MLILSDTVQIWDAWDGPRAFYHDIVEEDETLSKSLLFNAFIFMQVFNEINARKILDEYNIFAGIHHSPIFAGVLAITTVLQIVIVQTPVSSIFRVHPLNGAGPALERHSCAAPAVRARVSTPQAPLDHCSHSTACAVDCLLSHARRCATTVNGAGRHVLLRCTHAPTHPVCGALLPSRLIINPS